MDSDRWKKLDSLLQSVLERPPEEREAFLRQSCASDRALEEELRALVAIDQEARASWNSPRLKRPPSRSLAGQTRTQSNVETS